MSVGDKQIELQIWDTAGQERYRSLIPNYLRGASVVIVVYDVTDRKSFDHVKEWIDVVDDRDSVMIYLVGNKIDLERVISRDEGMKMSYDLGTCFIETSAKNDVGITDLFEDIATKMSIFEGNGDNGAVEIDAVETKGCC